MCYGGVDESSQMISALCDETKVWFGALMDHDGNVEELQRLRPNTAKICIEFIIILCKRGCPFIVDLRAE